MEIITHGGGELLFKSLNAVAMITSGGDFLDLVRTVVALSGIWLGFRTIFKLGGLKENLFWGSSFVLIYMSLIAPKVDVILYDRFDPTYVKKVDNVPYGLALIGGYSSQIGNGLAQIYDQAFAMPNDQAYTQTGLLFGNKVIRDTTSLKIRDRDFANNMSSFIENCVFYDIQTTKKYTYHDLLETADIWNFLTEENSPSKVWMFSYREKSNMRTVTCFDGANLLKDKWQNEIYERMVYLYERNFGKAPSEKIAKSYISSQIKNSNQYLMNISKDASDILRQNLMINAVNEAVDRSSPNADILAKLEKENTYRRYASMAQRTVVYLRTAIEIMLFGVFPFIFLIVLMPNGTKVMAGYIKAFIWLQLWPIMYAILHMMAMSENKEALEFASSMTLNNISTIDEITNEIALTAGYMMLSIPPLAWALVTGMQSMAYAAGSFLSASMSSASAAASEQTRGNYSVGNSSYDNHSFSNVSGNKFDSVALENQHGAQIHNQDGSISTIHGDGHQTIDTTPKLSKFASDIKSNYSISNSLSDMANQSKTMGDNLSTESLSQLSNSYDSASRMAKSYAQALENGESWAKSVDASTAKAFDDINSANSNWGGKLEAEAGKSGILSVVGKAVGVKGSGTLYKGFDNSSQEQARESMETIAKATQSGSLNITNSEGQSLSEEFNSTYSKYEQLSNKAETYYNEAENLSKEARSSQEMGINYSKDNATEFYNYLMTEKGYNQIDAIDLIEQNNPDKLDTFDHMYKSYIDDKVSHIYQEKYGSELMSAISGNLSKTNYDARSTALEEDNKIHNNNSVVSANYHLSKNQEVNKDLKQDIESEIKKREKEIEENH